MLESFTQFTDYYIHELESREYFTDFEFRVYHTNLDHSQSIISRPPPWIWNNNQLVESILFGYLESKYPLCPQPRETIKDLRIKFQRYLSSFERDPNVGLCQRIKAELWPNIFEKLELILGMSPSLNGKLSLSDNNWLNLLWFCVKLSDYNVSRLFETYLESRYNINHLEHELLDTGPSSTRLETWEILIRLEIFKKLYGTSEHHQLNETDLYRLLDAKVLDKEKCEKNELVAQLGLYRRQSNYPNMVGYLDEMLKKQWALCKRIFETRLKRSYTRIEIGSRRRVTNLRHDIEKLLNPPAREQEVWQLGEPRKSDLIKRGLLKHIGSRFKCNFENAQELRVEVYANLGPACESVHDKLSVYGEELALLVEFDIDFTDVTHSWMSALVICDHIMDPSFDWNSTFSDLTSSRE